MDRLGFDTILSDKWSYQHPPC